MNQKRIDDMIWDGKNYEYTCPECGSHKVYCKAGMMSDLYICNDCGFESRNLKEI